MLISLVAAISENMVIGKAGGLPWHIPEELRHFRQITRGKPVIMGRKTFESIGTPLPERHNIVLTSTHHTLETDATQGLTVVHTVEEALHAAGTVHEVMVIGGEQIYRLFLSKANRIYLSVIPGYYAGDAYFPEIFATDWVVREESIRAGFIFKQLDRR